MTTGPEWGDSDTYPHAVTVLPVGIVLRLAPDESILAAADRLDVAWPTRCHGRAACRTCFFEVDAASTAIAPPSRLEADALKRIVLGPPTEGQTRRLACQARVLADVVVRRPGVRYAEHE